MDSGSQNTRLVQRAYWLIKIRWMAVICVAFGTYFSSSVLGITLQDFALYGIALLLALYNTIVLLLLNRFTGRSAEVPCPAIKKIINFQISTDLLILTVLLHFSGGIENPFIFYFMFHMIISTTYTSPLPNRVCGPLSPPGRALRPRHLLRFHNCLVLSGIYGHLYCREAQEG
jgi:hypothetical protein